jgi:hypothetical protein
MIEVTQPPPSESTVSLTPSPRVQELTPPTSPISEHVEQSPQREPSSVRSDRSTTPSRQLLEEIEVLPEPPTQPSPVVQNICRSGRQTKKPDAYGEWVAHTAVAIATDTASGSTPTPTDH